MRFSTTRTGRRAAVAALVLACALAPGLAGLAGKAAAEPADLPALLTWSELAPRSSPPARVHGAMAFDAATGTTVLFGGRAGSQVLADTWIWDGSSWTAQTPATSPPPLEAASMVYDNIGHQVLLFGGVGADGTASSTTWAWAGAHPTGAASTATVSGPAGATTVSGGAGASGTTATAGTWVALAPTTSPPARYGASIAADGTTGTVVLFGGLAAPGSSLGDTWTWNGGNWALAAPAASPSARSSAAMTFDAARGAVVLFGGLTGSDNRADTWVWDGTTWSQQSPAVSPPARSDAAFGFDPATLTSVLFGGAGAKGALGDTWLWNGSNWSTSIPLSLLPALSPPARSGAALAPAPAPQRLVLFGGQSGGQNPTALGGTWSVGTALATNPPPPTTATTAAGPTTTASATTATAPPATVGTSTTAPPAPTIAPGRPAAAAPLDVASRSVRQGSAVRVSGTGFLPGAKITITLHSTAMVVGTTTADANGNFSVTVLVPHDAPLGEHHLEASGAVKSGATAVLVAQVRIAPPGANQSWWLPALMVALTVLVAAGAGLVLTASARGRSHRPA